MTAETGKIGAIGALSQGMVGMLGGGFFPTFGISATGAVGGTPVASLIGGGIALITAYSHIGLTLRCPGQGGTISFITLPYGQGLPAVSLNVLLVGVLVQRAVNFAPIAALSSGTSGGILLVYAAVNITAVRLASQTGSNRFVCTIAAGLSVVALIITVWPFLSSPAAVNQALAILGIVVVSLAIELAFRAIAKAETPRRAG